MKVIDIHVHVYDKIAGITKGAPITGEGYGRAKIGNRLVQFTPPSFQETTSPVETLIGYMDWCGIDKALLMPNPLYGYTNDYFIKAIAKYPGRLKGVALTDFIKGKEAAEELVEIYDKTDLFGYKIETDSTFQCAPGMHMTDAAFRPVWDVLEQYRQPVFLHLFTDRDVEDVAALVKMYPNIRFILCHMGADSCFRREGIHPGNFDFLLQLMKDQPNIYMDTSTVPEYYLPEEYPWAYAGSLVEKAYRMAGPEKLMWASDYPGMLKVGTMRQLIDYVMRNCQILPDDLEMIMGGNAERLFFET